MSEEQRPLAAPFDAPIDAPIETPRVKRKITRLSVEERRNQIAKACLLALQEHGHSGLTARKVAAAAGMSLGHLTYHFKDMDAILAAGFELAAEEVQRAGREALIKPGGTSSERLDRFLRAGFAGDLMTPAHLRMRVDLWSAALTHPAIAEIERALYASHREAVERLLDRMAAGYAYERIPAVADMILATLDGLWLDWLRRGDQAAVNNGLEGCVLFARLRLGGS